MRILFLTNFYPPYELGGQGRSCQQVVEGMAQRGHETLVLTSMHGTNNVPVTEAGVSRSLYLEMDFKPWRHALVFFTGRKERAAHNLRYLEKVLYKFEPDVVFVWGMWNLPRLLPALAEEQCPGRVVYRFAEYWPTLPTQHELYWRAPGRNWYSRLIKRLFGRIALAILTREESAHSLRFEHAICVSAATRKTLVEAGVPVANGRIIHTGLDVTPYRTAGKREFAGNGDQSLRLLYAGRFAPDKGIETAIRALARLVKEQVGGTPPGVQNILLRLAGSGPADYEQQLRRVVDQERVADYVSFLGRIPPNEMPELYRQFDLLIVPSTWPEPFARVVLEGMASGLVVVATTAGGTAEIVVPGENGMLFAPGNDQELAEAILRLARDPNLRCRLARAGRQTVLEQFTFEKMLNKIESYLLEIARAPQETITELAPRPRAQ